MFLADLKYIRILSKTVEINKLLRRFKMENWPVIRDYINRILRNQHYHGIRCFLTAYQIAVLVNEEDSSLKGDLPIGGLKTGPESFAKHIAKCLTNDIRRKETKGLEMQCLSKKGPNLFCFHDGHVQSGVEFSRFRIIS